MSKAKSGQGCKASSGYLRKAIRREKSLLSQLYKE